MARSDGGPDAGVVETEAVWFGPHTRPLVGWRSSRVDAHDRGGVLILPPVGYEYWSSHQTLRSMAERLVGLGLVVVRLDYDGTGDSAGDQWEPDRLSAWRASITAATAYLRHTGIQQLFLVGARLGATLALLDGAELGADAIVAWAPVESGRRYGRELALLGTPLPAASEVGNPGAGDVSYAGTVFNRQTLDELREIDLRRLAVAPSRRTLILDQSLRHLSDLSTTLRGLGCLVDLSTVSDSELALQQPAEDAPIATHVISVVCTWIASNIRSGVEASPPQEVRLATEANPSGRTMPWKSGLIREQVVRLGPRGLLAVRGECARGASGETASLPPRTVVFVNSGSEPHIGPGRAWVEYCRDLNVSGYRTLRLDYSGWGESPDLGHAPGRPYDHHTIEETRELIRALHAQGERVVLVGLCAGAWVFLAAAQNTPVAGIVAINPQLYWQPGDPVEARISDTHERRARERSRDQRWASRGVWSALDALGCRHPAGRWLDRLRKSGTPVLMLFSENDDGLTFLQTRVYRAWRRFLHARATQLVELPGLDHAMHNCWQRKDVLLVIRNFLDSSTVHRQTLSTAESRLMTAPGQ